MLIKAENNPDVNNIYTNLGFKLPALNYWSHPEQIKDHNVIVQLQTIDNLEKPNKPSLHSTITHNTVTRYIYSVY